MEILDKYFTESSPVGANIKFVHQILVGFTEYQPKI